MKKIKIILSLLFFAAFLTACSSTASKDGNSGNDKKQEEKSTVADITIENVEYNLPSEYDNASEGQYALKIDISVTNNGEDPLNIDESNFVLYQGDTLAGESDPEDHKAKLPYARLKSEKKLEGSLFYLVDKGEQYQLVYTSQEMSKEKQETIEFDIDGNDKKLLATLDKLQNPAKALSSYIDLIFYDNETEDFDKYVGEDKESLVNEFNAGIIEGFMSGTYLTEDELDMDSLHGLVDAMKAALKDKVKAKTVTKTISNDKAVVELTAKPLDVPSIQPILEKKVMEFAKDRPDITEAEAQNFVFAEMAKEFKNIKNASEEVTVEIKLIKADGDKWQIDPDDYSGAEQLATAFLKLN